MNKIIGEKAGLTYSGKNFFGENEFIGSKEQWEKAEELELLQEKDLIDLQIYDKNI